MQVGKSQLLSWPENIKQAARIPAAVFPKKLQRKLSIPTKTPGTRVKLPFRLEMDPATTRAVNKRPTHLWPRYFLTDPKIFYLIQRGENWKIWNFRGNFPNPDPNQKWLTQLGPTLAAKNWPYRPGSKFFDPVP